MKIKFLIILILFSALLSAETYEVAVITNTATSYSSVDTVIAGWIEEMSGFGNTYNVTILDDNTTPDTSAYDLMYISGNIFYGGNLDDELEPWSGAIITNKYNLKYRLGTASYNKSGSAYAWSYQAQDTNWISQYEPDSTKYKGSYARVCLMTGFSNDVKVLLKPDTGPDSAIVASCAAGDQLTDGTTAAGTRIHYGLIYAGEWDQKYLFEAVGKRILWKCVAYSLGDTLSTSFASRVHLITIGLTECPANWCEFGKACAGGDCCTDPGGCDSMIYGHDQWRFGMEVDTAKTAAFFKAMEIQKQVPPDKAVDSAILFGKITGEDFENTRCYNYRLGIHGIMKGDKDCRPAYYHELWDYGEGEYKNCPEEWPVPITNLHCQYYDTSAVDKCDDWNYFYPAIGSDFTEAWDTIHVDTNMLRVGDTLLLSLSDSAVYDWINNDVNGFVVYTDEIYNEPCDLDYANIETYIDWGDPNQIYLTRVTYLKICVAAVDTGGAGDPPNDCNDTTEITSVPYAIPSGDACYKISDGKISSSTNGIDVGGYDNVLIILADDTLEFGTGDGNSNYGIRIGSGAHNIVLEGGNIIHGVADASEADSNICLKLDGGDTLLVDSVNMIIRGQNGHCITNGVSTSVKNLEVHAGHYENKVHSFERRDYYDAATIYFYSGASLSAGEYHMKVHGIYSSGPHAQIFWAKSSVARPLVYIYDDTLYVDGRNEKYEYPQTQPYFGWMNPYAIAGYGWNAHSYVRNNRIIVGSTYGGGDGILIEGAHGTPTSPIYIDSNYIEVSSGPNQLDWNADQGGECVAIYLRFPSGTSNMNDSNVIIRDNEIKVWVDGDTGTTHIGRVGEGIRILMEDDFVNNIIERNHVEVCRVDSVSPNGGTRTAAFSVARADTADMTGSDNVSGNIIRNNFGYAWQTPLWLGCRRASELGGNLITLSADTFSCHFEDPDSAFALFPQVATYRYRSMGCNLDDAILLDSASDSAIIFNTFSEEWGPCQGKDLSLRKTVTVHVKDTGDLPLMGASVWIWNNYGDTIYVDTTLADGNATTLVKFAYRGYDGDGADDCTVEDSIGFNDFWLKAQKDTDKDSAQVTINFDYAGTQTFTLPNQQGEQPKGSRYGYKIK